MNSTRELRLQSTRCRRRRRYGLAHWLATAMVFVGSGNPSAVAAEQRVRGTDAGNRLTAHREPAKVRLGLALETIRGRQTVVVTLRNDVAEPIQIDRNLVFGVDVTVRDERRAVLDKHVRDASTKPWTEAAWKQRIVTLSPGESLSRRIDIDAGVTQFSFGHALGGNEAAIGASEEVFTVDRDRLWKKDRGPIWLAVTCGMRWGERAALERYTGLPERVRELTDLTGFRAINLETGRELNEMQYAIVSDEEDRLTSEDNARCETTKIALKLTLEREDGHPVVVITAENTSARPMTMDRELVFGLWINVESDGASLLTPEQNVSVKDWSWRTWEKRMAVLRLGESLSRRVDLAVGIRNLALVDKAAPPQGERRVGEYIYKVRSLEALKSGKSRALLTVYCGALRGRFLMERYTSLPTQVGALPRLSGFRAIDLTTGNELDYEQYIGTGETRGK